MLEDINISTFLLYYLMEISPKRPPWAAFYLDNIYSEILSLKSRNSAGQLAIVKQPPLHHTALNGQFLLCLSIKHAASSTELYCTEQ